MKMLLQKPSESSKLKDFFIEGKVVYSDKKKVSKCLMQLFKENIFRYVGSIREEVEKLLLRIYEAEMITEEDIKHLQK
eukprot:gene4604-14947_t